MARELTAPRVAIDRRRKTLIARNGAFARAWAAQLLSQSATRMYQMGALWWLLGQVATGDRGLASGLFLVCAALPPVVFAPSWRGRWPPTPAAACWAPRCSAVRR